MPVRASSLVADIESALAAGPRQLARAALLLGRIESPGLPLEPAMATLGALCLQASETARQDGPVRERLGFVRRLMYDLAGFAGDREHYDDLRNSLLSVVLERKLGIPITLAVIYMTIARSAGVEIFGITFPGHFLMRVSPDAGGPDDEPPIVLDPFDAGRELDRGALDALLARHAGGAATLDASLLAPCTPRQMVVRMLNNMKRLYVGSRSFPQAWHATDLLVALGGRQPEDIRDRGLIAYHLDDFPGALLDLETYSAMEHVAGTDSEERRQVWDHIASLRRRVAAMN